MSKMARINIYFVFWVLFTLLNMAVGNFPGVFLGLVGMWSMIMWKKRTVKRMKSN